MRRLALLMIFSIVATMTFGCGKTEGEEKSTRGSNYNSGNRRAIGNKR